MIESKSIADQEKEILKFWKENQIFEKSLEQTKSSKPYIFYDGPPFATGLPHYGHLLASTLKDVFPRFFTMKDRYVRRVWGWDCHGLPIENIVEKILKINGKDEIEKMGIKKFNNTCRNQVLTFANEWEKYIDRIGRWVDFDKSYKTMDNEYIESVWWAFKQLYDKGYLYEGEKVLLYCPRCSTPLAKSEIAMDNSYKTIKDLSIVVKLEIKGKENTYALAWTTTPWTLPSNLALAVNPKIDYVYVKDKNDNNTYILAKELLSKFYKSKAEYVITKELKGKDLENLEYSPLFNYFKNTPNAFKIVLGDFVTAEEGTGIVHIAPAFGEDDNEISKKYKIPMVQPVDEKGLFTKEVTDYAGEFIHDINEKIVIDLKKSNKAIMSQKIEHEYPFCYRCDTKLMFRALPAWFVNIQKIKKKLLKLNQNINWIPDFLKDGQLNHNITNAPDWNITRNRYWASAMPLWKSEDGNIKVIGSIKELKELAINLPKGNIDLHKDYLDQIEFKIDGKIYKRIPEVLDVWFESGSMPFAQFHYPFENKEFFEKNFPAQLVIEYIAQTRTWFYYMMVLSAIIFDKIPFQNVLTTGNILAEDGHKMSKSRNNFEDPMIIMDKYGSDALRFYLLQSPVTLAENMDFSKKNLEEVYKKIILLLYNVNNFYDLYKNIPDSKIDSKNILDKWIISETNILVSEVEKQLSNYNTVKACSAIRNYVDGLSTWYVRRTRNRFNNSDVQAKASLKYALENLSKVIAPIMPFVADKIYQTINGKNSSVHLEKWPNYDKKLINLKIIEEMIQTRSIVSITLRERDRIGIGIKWPLQNLKINIKELSKEYVDIIKDETNIKEIKFQESSEDLKVTLDTNLTPELEAEGFAREISRKIQSLRKEAALVKEDRISLEIISPFNDKIKKFEKDIKEKVGAKTISWEDSNKNFSHSGRGKIKNLPFKITFNKL
ncbi:MAG: isoleucine--tRNA ligase [Nanoarchaeota archaeon]|nr:isoleucine--tRNA ligase [Nanoarchaeota archaeon]